MNSYEKEMSNILFDLVDNRGTIGIKTSFEDEGATFNEVLRLKEVCNQSGTKINLKIGGPEAKRDLKDAMIIGVKGIVAPMVESQFGLDKFVQAVDNVVIDQKTKQSLNLAINVETITAVSNLDSILQSEYANSLYGITIGRVDLIGSMGIARQDINSKKVCEIVAASFEKIKKAGLKTMMGGGLDRGSKDFVSSLQKQGLIDRVETRYVMFDASVCLNDFESNLRQAQMFELNWLKNKAETYGHMSSSERNRMLMIKERLSN